MKTNSRLVALLAACTLTASAQTPALQRNLANTNNASKPDFKALWQAAQTRTGQSRNSPPYYPVTNSTNSIVAQAKLRRSKSAEPPSRTTSRTVLSTNITERGPHSRVVQSVISETNKFGRATVRTNSYTELATGLHYLEKGEWKETRNLIEPFQGGAIARFGPHKVIFEANLNTVGALDVEMAEGERLRAHVLGLRYFDSNSGETVLLAQVRDSQGQIAGSNQVLYTDCFASTTEHRVQGSVRYTFRKSGLAQDVIIHDLPSPETFNLNTASTRLQVLSEFLNPPHLQTSKREPLGKLEDCDLNFGTMRIGRGRAFSLGNEKGRDSIPVRKELLRQDGRTILVEDVPAKTALEKLSKTRGASLSPATNKVQRVAINGRTLPKAPGTKRTHHSMQMASAKGLASGYVIDYEVLESQNTLTLKGDTTYFISDTVSTIEVIVEGGTVVKFAPWMELWTEIVSCRTAAYCPGIFTSQDDDTVGDSLPWSSGSPLDYGGYGISILGYSLTPLFIHDLRMKYFDAGIMFWEQNLCNAVKDCQFTHCSRGIFQGTWGSEEHGRPSTAVQNCLFTDCYAALDGTYCSFSCENVTFSQLEAVHSQWDEDPTTSVVLKNCILANVNNLYIGYNSVSGSYNGFYNSPTFGTSQYTTTAAPFQTSGGGNHYLANGDFRGKGTTAIDSQLLASLKQKTTYPPISFPHHMEVTGELTLFPQVPRYVSGAPDLGYYYDVLDYTVATTILEGGTITVQPGTAIGVRNDPFYDPTEGWVWTSAGFWVRQGATFYSRGTPIAPVTYTAVRLVQEGPFDIGWNFCFAIDHQPWANDDPPPNLDFRFSNFCMSQEDINIISGMSWEFYWWYTWDSSMNLRVRDCNFRAGRIILGPPGLDDPDDPITWLHFPSGSVEWVNNLFDRVKIALHPAYYAETVTSTVDLSFNAYNNLFHGGWLRITPNPTWAGDWVFKDNLFDKVAIHQETSMPLDHDYNGYWPRLSSEFEPWQAHDKLLPDDNDNGTDTVHDKTLAAAPAYQNGPVGAYYLPTSSPLWNAGSRSAAAAGLFQYTTRLNQTKEGGEGTGNLVNIGLHYVTTANSSSALPKDSDGDGVPDYVEDSNGNDAVDDNETSPTLAMTDGTTNDAYSAVYDDTDLSGNGLVGRIKRALGLNPLSANNPLMLTQITTGEEPDIATFEVPTSYDALTNIGTLQLLMDGKAASFQECNRTNNGNCLLKWNTTYDLPDQHYPQAQLTLNGMFLKGSMPDPTVLTAAGKIIPFYSSNVCQFDPFYAEFDSDGAILYATTPDCPDASYTIELQTPSGQHIKTITNSTASGAIKEYWDLTDDNGNIITNEEVTAVFNVTLLDPATGTHKQKLFRSDFSSAWDGDFTVAYAWKDDSLAQGAMRDCVQWGVVDELIKPTWVGGENDNPYTSTFNDYSWSGGRGNPGYISSQTNVSNLLANLALLTTRNFHFDGHGSAISIGNGKKESDPGVINIPPGDVIKVLQNNFSTSGYHRKHPYRFVFLNSCNSADDDNWHRAFGVVNRITAAELADKPLKVQAFVGWYKSAKGPNTSQTFYDFAETYAVFYGAWMSGASLDQCIDMASSTDPFGNGLVTLNFPLGQYYSGTDTWYMANNFRIRIYGYAGITRTGYQSGHDNSKYYR